MVSAHTHRNSFYEKGKSGFSYPVLVNSAVSYVEVSADNQKIKAVLKDLKGNVIAEYDLK